MVMVFRLFSFVIALFFSSQLLSAELIASVDRNKISENDRFVLQLKYTERVGGDGPDLTRLEKDFEVFNKQTSNQYRSVNGKSESFTLWSISIMPKRLGQLLIPSIEYKGVKSRPIRITVSKLSQALKDKLAKDFFFDTQIDVKQGIVQGQILYSEKMYFRVNHNDATLSDVKVTDALVVPLADAKQYLTNINGQQYGVYERNYAIFPEKSGELIIPGTRFNANIPNPYNRWDPGKPVSAVAKPIRLKINSKPTNYPQAPWLPSKQLTIKNQWSQKYNEWVVGEPVTRTIIIKADGLSASLLPSIAMTEVKNLKYYPDQSDQKEDKSDTGIVGQRTESIAIVPTETGRFTLPEIRVAWWNINSQTIEHAIIPAMTVMVNAAEVGSAQKPVSLSATPLNDLSAVNSANSQAQQGFVASGFWLISSLVLLVSNIISAYFLWRRSDKGQTSVEQNQQQQTQRQLIKNIRSSCKKNQPQAIRQALIDWLSSNYNCSVLSQLPELMPLSAQHKQSFNNALNELDAALYSPQKNSAFNGQNIWQLFSQAQKSQKEKQPDQKLKGLYD